MIYIQKDTTNTIDVTVSNETTLTGATYLFELVNLERKSKVRFIPENVTTDDKNRFDSFNPNPNDKFIGYNMFMNSTRSQVKDLTHHNN
jgi:hypothetical protein